jgi:hypothetical protein
MEGIGTQNDDEAISRLVQCLKLHCWGRLCSRVQRHIAGESGGTVAHLGD